MLEVVEEIVVLYSAKVYKWNKFTIKQERVLVVTNLNVYNFHKKSNPIFVLYFRGAPRNTDR